MITELGLFYAQDLGFADRYFCFKYEYDEKIYSFIIPLKRLPNDHIPYPLPATYLTLSELKDLKNFLDKTIERFEKEKTRLTLSQQNTDIGLSQVTVQTPPQPKS